MTSPVAAGTAPIKVSLENGKDYWWCTCGRSTKQPFCDGAHKAVGMAPLKYTAQKDGDHWLCACKATKNSPLCDGTHKTV